MANHLYTRPAGIWNTSTDLLAAELADLDAKTVDSLSATGGTYSFTEDMNIGGDPFVAWVFDLQTTFNAGSIFGSTVLFMGDVTLRGLTTFDDSSVFNGAVTLNDYANFAGAADFQSNITVFGVASLQGGVNLGGAVSVSGPTTFSAAAPAAFAGTVTTSGSGTMRVRRVRRQTAGADTDATIDVTLTDHVSVAAGVLSATRAYTISDTGAVNGDRVRFSNFNTGFGIAVKNPGGTTLEAIISGSGSPTWVDVERIDGSWRLFPGPDNP